MVVFNIYCVECLLHTSCMAEMERSLLKLSLIPRWIWIVDLIHSEDDLQYEKHVSYAAMRLVKLFAAGRRAVEISSF